MSPAIDQRETPSDGRFNRGRRVLVFRLSSLGDVILSSSVLGTLAQGETADWVAAKEFAELLVGHPRVARVWEFERKHGFFAWIALCDRLWKAGYDEIWDLHGSLRSRIARVAFAIWSITRAGRGRERGRGASRWRRISKQRGRRLGFFLFKKFWPEAWRPRPLSVACAKLAGGSGFERPDLGHLLVASSGDRMGAAGRQSGRMRICLMPGAAWAGKRWPSEHFVRAIGGCNSQFIVLGRKEDPVTRGLCEKLESAGINYEPAIGLSLAGVARVLGGADLYLGNDTGLAHLAEAVGTPAWVVFGPTHPAMGFGPWRAGSRSFGADLWCRPCSKDGRACFRLFSRHLCLSTLDPQKVAENVKCFSLVRRAGTDAP